MASPSVFSPWHKSNGKRSSGVNKLLRFSSSRQLSPASPSPTTISNKLVSEVFWPSSIEKEGDKAARILYSFCKHGMYQNESRENSPQTVQKQKTWTRIPEEVIANAKGIVIFTAMRAGLWVSGAGGSGLVLARTGDGSWSWPVAIEIHTAELGFLLGADIYDCILILNSSEALDAFSKSRCIIGGDLYAIPGPLSVGWFFGTDTRSKQAPIFSYLRSRGYYAAVQLDHAFVVERSEENQRFYDSAAISPRDIFAGNHSTLAPSTLPLFAILRASEGKSAPNDAVEPIGPPPSDFEVVEEGHSFGVPDKDDPDPFGVYALEKQGFMIKEAGSNTSPTQESFEFNPSITSPVYEKYNRRSSENLSARTSWRRSVTSTTDRHDNASIISGHTDRDSIPPPSPGFSNMRNSSTFQSDDQRAPLDRRHSNPSVTVDSSVGENANSRHSLTHRSPKITLGSQTIYEGQSLDTNNLQNTVNNEFEATDSIMDRMVDMLQGEDQVRETRLSSGSRIPLHLRSKSLESGDIGTTPLWLDSDDSQLKNLSDSELNETVNGHVRYENNKVESGSNDNVKVEAEKSMESNEELNKVNHKDLQPLDTNTDEINKPIEEKKKEEVEIVKPGPISENKESNESVKGSDSDDDEYFSDLEDEPGSPVEIHDAIIQGGPAPIYQSAATIVKPKARIVTVTKTATPTLPQRNPGRLRPGSVTPSLEEKVPSSTDPDSIISSHQNGNSSTDLSSSPPVQGLPPSSNEAQPDTPKPLRPYSEGHLQPTIDTAAPKRLSLDTTTIPKPPTTIDHAPPGSKASLANLRQDLEASPSPEATSPGFDRNYFP